MNGISNVVFNKKQGYRQEGWGEMETGQNSDISHSDLILILRHQILIFYCENTMKKRANLMQCNPEIMLAKQT